MNSDLLRWIAKPVFSPLGHAEPSISIGSFLAWVNIHSPAIPSVHFVLGTICRQQGSRREQSWADMSLNHSSASGVTLALGLCLLLSCFLRDMSTHLTGPLQGLSGVMLVNTYMLLFVL